MKIKVVHAPNIKILEIQTVCSIYAPNDYVYVTFDKEEYENFPNFLKDLHKAEKEKNEWIRKYENVLNGLNYWKGKANEFISQS